MQRDKAIYNILNQYTQFIYARYIRKINILHMSLGISGITTNSDEALDIDNSLDSDD
jgi:hypothetical protein